MKSICSKLALVICALGVALGIGCKAKDAPAPLGDAEAIRAAQQLPGGTNALAALDKKDYEGAVKELVTLKATVSSPEQDAAFVTLKQHVKNKLVEVLADPKAAEALKDLSMLTQGR